MQPSSPGPGLHHVALLVPDPFCFVPGRILSGFCQAVDLKTAPGRPEGGRRRWLGRFPTETIENMPDKRNTAPAGPDKGARWHGPIP